MGWPSGWGRRAAGWTTQWAATGSTCQPPPPSRATSECRTGGTTPSAPVGGKGGSGRGRGGQAEGRPRSGEEGESEKGSGEEAVEWARWTRGVALSEQPASLSVAPWLGGAAALRRALAILEWRCPSVVPLNPRPPPPAAAPSGAPCPTRSKSPHHPEVSSGGTDEKAAEGERTGGRQTNSQAGIATSLGECRRSKRQA